ncbi:MAG: ferrous iron transport protein B [Alphaproteobacteria bacterium]|nr:ferrous iron transport protein B [Alphaproteobacteria bacterium]
MALVGAPNCGKSTLFNGLTGGRAKVANYPGATVEMRKGWFRTPKGRDVELIDLPGFYGLTPRSMDGRIAVDAIAGRAAGLAPPDLLVVLINAANLKTHLHSVLQLRALGRPMILALNMIDLATRDGLVIDVKKLEDKLGLPVVTSRAPRKAGRAELLEKLDRMFDADPLPHPPANPGASLHELQRDARVLYRDVIVSEPMMNRATRAIDDVVLHPIAGPLILAAILFLVFQAVFSWSAAPMDAIDQGVAALGDFVTRRLPDTWVRSLLVDGVIAGVGSVVVFLPQILTLFAFILIMEASGYMARAAFLMDELMSRVGLNGRAFIPLLSSFACAIPGIMAARVIESERDRLTTILIAPLMTCSARIPVYTLIIAAFVPVEMVGPFNLQGLVMFGLYLSGVAGAVAVAFVLKRTVTKGRQQPLIMELPTYKMPDPKDFLLSLWGRAMAFLKRAGTIILAMTVLIWFLASFPEGASLRESFAGRIGALIEPILKPIGFNLEIAIALIPGLAAREVAVGALGTVYAVQNVDASGGLANVLQSAWPLPTALAFLAWYVFAPQCFATLATIRRETNSWRWTVFAFGYLMALAYLAAGATHAVAELFL